MHQIDRIEFTQEELRQIFQSHFKEISPDFDGIYRATLTSYNKTHNYLFSDGTEVTLDSSEHKSREIQKLNPRVEIIENIENTHVRYDIDTIIVGRKDIKAFLEKSIRFFQVGKERRFAEKILILGNVFDPNADSSSTTTSTLIDFLEDLKKSGVVCLLKGRNEEMILKKGDEKCAEFIAENFIDCVLLYGSLFCCSAHILNDESRTSNIFGDFGPCVSRIITNAYCDKLPDEFSSRLTRLEQNQILKIHNNSLVFISDKDT